VYKQPAPVGGEPNAHWRFGATPMAAAAGVDHATGAATHGTKRVPGRCVVAAGSALAADQVSLAKAGGLPGEVCRAAAAARAGRGGPRAETRPRRGGGGRLSRASGLARESARAGRPSCRPARVGGGGGGGGGRGEGGGGGGGGGG